MFYLVTIGYESEQQDRNGNPRIQKVKYVVEAESVEETTIIGARYIGGGMLTGELLSVVQLPVECVISPLTYPDFYKGKKTEKKPE